MKRERGGGDVERPGDLPGGHAGGQHASALAVNTVEEMVDELIGAGKVAGERAWRTVVWVDAEGAPGDAAADRAGWLRSQAEALAALDHPAIPRVVAFGQTPDGEPYLALPWIEGPTLAMRLHEAGYATTYLTNARSWAVQDIWRLLAEESLRLAAEEAASDS